MLDEAIAARRASGGHDVERMKMSKADEMWRSQWSEKGRANK
jgi:hypothetical protein